MDCISNSILSSSNEQRGTESGGSSHLDSPSNFITTFE